MFLFWSSSDIGSLVGYLRSVCWSYRSAEFFFSVHLLLVGMAVEPASVLSADRSTCQFVLDSHCHSSILLLSANHGQDSGGFSSPKICLTSSDNCLLLTVGQVSKITVGLVSGGSLSLRCLQ